MSIYTYLTFNGNCRQAMTFYQKCLGGKLTFQTVGHTPGAHALPTRARRSILHATLRKGNLLLVGTDLVGEQGLLKGNAVSMLLHCKTRHKAQMIYDRLSRNGRRTQSMAVNHFGVVMGSVTDQFGCHWILTVAAGS